MDFEIYPPDYKKGGLEYLMTFSRNSKAYEKFVWLFSRKLVELADKQGSPKVRPIRDFDSMTPPFPGTNKPSLKVVRYVFVAGMRHQMPQLGRTCNSYPTYVDRRDWEPLFPDLHRTVEGIVTGPAKADSRTYEFLEPSAGLMVHLREARRLNNVIVVVVDPWSLRVNELRQFLNDFDAEEFPNSAVLVNWNPKDTETTEQTAQLRLLLQDHFRGRIGRKEFHKDPISSVEKWNKPS
jgi:FxsC-like protein